MIMIKIWQWQKCDDTNVVLTGKNLSQGGVSDMIKNVVIGNDRFHNICQFYIYLKISSTHYRNIFKKKYLAEKVIVKKSFKSDRGWGVK